MSKKGTYTVTVHISKGYYISTVSSVHCSLLDIQTHTKLHLKFQILNKIIYTKMALSKPYIENVTYNCWALDSICKRKAHTEDVNQNPTEIEICVKEDTRCWRRHDLLVKNSKLTDIYIYINLKKYILVIENDIPVLKRSDNTSTIVKPPYKLPPHVKCKH